LLEDKEVRLPQIKIDLSRKDKMATWKKNRRKMVSQAIPPGLSLSFCPFCGN